MKDLTKLGIPKERIRLTAQSIKFPTAETMFDFINKKYNEYLVSDGAKLENYTPWLNSTMAIPPMAGGAGRRRALAKAIYGLNYYQLGIIRNQINTFKEQALSSIITPTVVLVYGLGGGTGSGIFFDFARHLRKVLGSSIPIIAFVIAPCNGDDPPAKGCSAFVAMTELALLLNKDYNEHVIKNFGEPYRNPLNALLWLPLLPAYTKVGNIITARREVDEMFVDLLYTLMDFDLADLMGGIGTEVGLTNNFVHTIGQVKVIYPIDSYIEAMKRYYEKLELLHDHRAEKLEIMDAIYGVIQANSDEIRNLYRNYLIRTGTFVEEQFEDMLNALIYNNPRLEEDYALHVKAIEDQMQTWVMELTKFLATIKMMGKTGPIEEAIINFTLKKENSRKIDNLEILLANLTKTHRDFSEKKAYIFERLKHLIPSSQIFTVRQKRILEDFMNLTDLGEKALAILKFYDANRYLTEALIAYYETLPESDNELAQLHQVRGELQTLYLVVQLMLRTPQDEAKMIDEHLTYLNEITGRFMAAKADSENDLTRIQESKKRKDYDRVKLDKQTRKMLGSKKYARERLLNIERDIKRLNEEEAMAGEALAKMDGTIQLYDSLSRKIEVTSDYRKRLLKIVDIANEYAANMADILEPKKFFERSTEITELEQIKIIFKILTEQEDSLTREVIAKDILDIAHYKDYMKSLVRMFKTPSVMGFKPTYKTDYIWVTVTSPPKMWTEDLTQELYTVLAGYVTSEVSRTVTVRVVESRDDWITRILVVAGRGKAEDLEAFDEMQLLYTKSNDFERHLSRSYLIEHGISAPNIISGLNPSNNNGNNNNAQKKNQ
jgi:hypothetical protein